MTIRCRVGLKIKLENKPKGCRAISATSSWSKPREVCHAWTDGSFREAAGVGWLITKDSKGEGPVIAEGARNLGGQQTAFDAEVAAIE
jgi:hypothetical protein